MLALSEETLRKHIFLLVTRLIRIFMLCNQLVRQSFSSAGSLVLRRPNEKSTVAQCPIEIRSKRNSQQGTEITVRPNGQTVCFCGIIWYFQDIFGLAHRYSSFICAHNKSTTWMKFNFSLINEYMYNFGIFL